MKVKFLFLSLVVFAAVNNVQGQHDYKTQTLFIYNFIKYTSWPEQGKEFVILVYGESPIVGELQKLADVKKNVNGAPITILKINSLDALKDCNILYVSYDRSKDMEQLATTTKGKPYLIISPKDGMVRKGAVLNFFTKDDERLGFEVSRTKLNERNIKISGELMRLAELAD
jgi:hypothetical protein